MPEKSKTSFRSRAKAWAAKESIHGPQAFFRFVIFTYLDCLSKSSDEFVFKGGNLLWLYIRTPRETIDLDLVTRKVRDTSKIKDLLERASRGAEGIEFKVISIKEVTAEGEAGAAVTIGYSTEDGASNKFDLDIVYVLPTRSTKIQSPLPGREELTAATIENIVGDKIATCHRFGGGNTRMKDYDDLWRLASENRQINWKVVDDILAERGFPRKILLEWLNDEMEAQWKRHSRNYKDLPNDLVTVMKAINGWLYDG